MPRRKKSSFVREIAPDPVYSSVLVSKFINVVMLNGKKRVAEKFVYRALSELSERVKLDPIEAFQAVIDNVKPLVELRSRRVGGANYQVPVEVSPRRGLSLAFRWLKNGARARTSEKSFEKKLAAELIDAYYGRGLAIKKKEETHKMAEANRAFVHFRW
ncbi:MAG: 30S ribosomal protein S7 [Deltaproteobacteria bacterium]|nr:30S ribosomal protein S7 [Deltaproteobacteria bacterium]MCX7952933.1 30S ribosomal protein S7 [Deltaproteobacteria bacterium]